MLEIVTGIIAGMVSGIGMGGGTILILILSLFYGMDQHVAQASNLIFFIPTSIAAIYINIKQKMIDFKIALLIGGIGSIGALLGSYFSKQIDSNLLRKCFGVFLAIIAVHEIYSYVKMYIYAKKRDNIDNKEIKDRRN